MFCDIRRIQKRGQCTTQQLTDSKKLYEDGRRICTASPQDTPENIGKVQDIVKRQRALPLGS